MRSRLLLATSVVLLVSQAGLSQDRARGVQLQGQSNFRDLGGYTTKDGKTVKRNMIYRSGELSALTPQDVAKLGDLKIQSVINFLTQAEIDDHGKDKLPQKTKEYSLPLKVGDNLAKTAQQAIKTGNFSKLPPSLNREIHEIIALESTKEYAKLFRMAIEEKQRPLVFHCSHGVHRTGTAAAILLWTLGVRWETVREDYLLSNSYRKAETEKKLAQLQMMVAKKQQISPKAVDMTNIRAFYILKASYIDGTRDAILKKYGSLAAYLRDGLGLTPKEIKMLQEQLLE